ncbi:uncharacterized protein BP5553_05207 [Venustampulla echinocandica]|uniref:Uncharacterized protein n=1 Tax=Venustampulla echinocandica TaxID=2656787 RepID=A0A370TQI9_9HELO|nr:uncharacterized protein BP5553_05207 [Venustampulla echinocandica]RDL37774.1 hypothetical protein BP5553_05207 [Venustampulla echinocandica]
MFATRVLRQAAAAERTPMIKFIGKRPIPESIDHSARNVHPASPSPRLPSDFTSAPSAANFSSYRQKAIQHGPLSRGIGAVSGQSLGPVAPAKGEYFDRDQLPARFRRSLLDMAEIDAIETGEESEGGKSTPYKDENKNAMIPYGLDPGCNIIASVCHAKDTHAWACDDWEVLPGILGTLPAEVDVTWKCSLGGGNGGGTGVDFLAGSCVVRV